MKKCWKCKTEKIYSFFYNNKARKNGLSDWCKNCCNLSGKKYRQSHKEQTSKRWKKYYLEYKEERKFYRDVHKRDKREYDLQTNYGVGIEWVENQYKKVGGKCPLCNNAMKLGGVSKGAAFVDHDHKTGKVRGLICFSCNHLLGYAYDNITTLERVIKYLKGGL